MIHKYILNGFFIVLDVNSGAIHVVDKLMYEMLDNIILPVAQECPTQIIDEFCKCYDKADIIDTYSEIYKLFLDGQLFSADDYEKFSTMMVSSPVKAMCLHIAHDCNLRCDYCFAGKGDYDGKRLLMPLEVGLKSIDFLIKHSYGRKNLEVDFFGGEPLMNFDVVKEIVKYARSLEKEHNKVFRFTITTNGMLLNDDIIDFINDEMSNVVLSIDGRKDVNDRVRRRVDGRGCYDAIIPKFINLVNKRKDKDYYVRGTFTKYNKDFANDVLHLNSLGFDQISVEPVVSDSKLDYSLTEADLPEVFAEYERLANIMIEKEKQGTAFNFFHFMLDLDQGPCAIKRLRGCGCGNEYCAVTPDGEIFPCHQFASNPEWKMGNIFDMNIDNDMKNKFALANVYGKDECNKCWAKFYCSGGCNANNLQYSGNILSPHKLACELQKKRLECAIMIKAALAD